MGLIGWAVLGVFLVGNLGALAWGWANWRRYEDTPHRRDQRFRERIVKNERDRIRGLKAIR